MFVDRCGALGSYTKSGTCRDASCTAELVFNSSDTGVASESWVSRRDTNADRIIEALDKHTGENCHDVIARPGGVSELKRARTVTVESRGEQGESGLAENKARSLDPHFHLLRRPFVGKLSRAVFCAACFPAHPGQHSADSLDAADIGFPANGNSSSWSNWEQ
ncbi:hypothetical protein BO83DRAFT_412582 [Aspergillus eucalypticola CBS 122712]|uniref:Uncharacterized protein n=1 Tax=Aspergillus eucalypticola (strain CBS 122712 / IBT 29274) TaxID=1448314 RepID=A0A317ULY8_ASPEC|nr:uncharacterized protein BO83DRAFT_412582 [Aspergillus eucalypticola CBS 122712]PWY62409.1 hypothetical protein BO83DRAFT_412582 [Aspergillus eucalypticola CBS 122712]